MPSKFCVYVFYFFLMRLAFFSPFVNAQQNSINGVVAIFNSKTKTGVTEYVANASVKDDNDYAQATLTDNKGFFTLIYVGLQEGKTVYFNIKKERLQVINFTSQRGVLGQTDTIKISMAVPSEISDYRNNIYNIGVTSAQKRLVFLITEKNNQLKQLKRDSIRQSNNIKDLTAELIDLRNQKNNIQNIAEELANTYTKVNLDDATPIFKNAFEKFQNGYLDSALMILNNVNFKNSANEINNEQNDITKEDSELALRKAVLNQRKGELLKTLQLKADLNEANFSFDTVFDTYSLMLSIDERNKQTIYNFSNFCLKQNKYKEAIQLGNRFLKIETDNFYIANTFGLLGRAFFQIKRYDSASKYAIKELKEIKVLSKTNQTKYADLYVTAYDLLGGVCIKSKKLDSAKYYYDRVLNIIKKPGAILDKNPLIIIAQTFNNFGAIYSEKGQYNLAKSFFVDGITKLNTLTNNERIDPELNFFIGFIYYDLGKTYEDLRQIDSAKLCYLKSYKLIETFATKNPFAFNYNLFQSANNLGVIYEKENNDSANFFYQKALYLIKNLYDQDSSLYLHDFVMAHVNSEGYYSELGNDSAVIVYNSCFKILDEQHKDHQNDFSISQYYIELNLNLANYYANQGNTILSRRIVQKVNESNISMNDSQLIIFYNICALTQFHDKNYDSSIYFFQKVRHILNKKPFSIDSSYYLKSIENFVYTGNVYFFEGLYDSAKKYYMQVYLPYLNLIRNKKEIDKNEFANLLYKLAIAKLNTNDTDFVYENFTMALSIFNKITITKNYETTISYIFTLYELGTIYLEKSNLDSSLKCYIKAIESINRYLRYDFRDYQLCLAQTSYSLALYYNHHNESKKAVQYFIIALSSYQFLVDADRPSYQPYVNCIINVLEANIK